MNAEDLKQERIPEGTYVKVIKAEDGARGAEGRVGEILPYYTKSSNGLSNNRKGYKFRMECGDVWNIGENVKLEVVKVNNSLYGSLKESIDRINGETSIRTIDNIIRDIGEVTMKDNSVAMTIEIGINDIHQLVTIHSAYHKDPQYYHYNTQCKKLKSLKEALMYLLNHSKYVKEECYSRGDMFIASAYNTTWDVMLAQVGEEEYCFICCNGNRLNEPQKLKRNIDNKLPLSEIKKLCGNVKFLRNGKTGTREWY